MPISRKMTGGFAGLVAALAAVLALTSTASVSFAGFSAQIVNSNNTFSAGTMQLQETSGAINCYSTGSGGGGTVGTNSATCATINKLVGTLDQVPAGSPLTTTITMKNNGTIAATLESLGFGSCTAAAASDANLYVGSDTSGFCGKVDFSVGTRVSVCTRRMLRHHAQRRLRVRVPCRGGDPWLHYPSQHTRDDSPGRGRHAGLHLHGDARLECHECGPRSRSVYADDVEPVVVTKF